MATKAHDGNPSTVDALAGIKIVDTDTHWSEPYDLWTSRAPTNMKDRVPQPRIENGVADWYIDGDKRLGNNFASSAIWSDGTLGKGTDFMTWQLPQVHPASWDVDARLAMMDQTGIWAQIVYPNILGFGGRKSMMVDPELRLLSTQIYNDFGAETQEKSGNRLFPQALLPWWDIDLAVKEAERAKAMGLRGVNINPTPNDHEGLKDIGDPAWDRLWQACSDMDLPVNFHIGASDESFSWYGDAAWPSASPETAFLLGGANMFLSNIRTMANILMSGLLERNPKLKMVSVESGIGWIPFLLQALDYQVEHATSQGVAHLTMKPSEYFKRQVYACFWFENQKLPDLIEQVGVDNVMFETDFPHCVCLHPTPVEHVAAALAGASRDMASKVLSGNAAHVYNLPLN